MTDRVASLVQTGLSTLALLTAVIVFGVTGERDLAHVALGGLLAYVVPVVAPQIPRPVAVAGALALVMAVSTSGCTPLQARVAFETTGVVARLTCAGATKLCGIFGRSDACDAIERACSFVPGVATTQGGEEAEGESE
jgi:hypothetical protein